MPGATRPKRPGVVTGGANSVGFDAYAWFLTDPETGVGAAPLADVPSLGGH